MPSMEDEGVTFIIQRHSFCEFSGTLVLSLLPNDQISSHHFYDLYCTTSNPLNFTWLFDNILVSFRRLLVSGSFLKN
jgi:hypothetical protein